MNRYIYFPRNGNPCLLFETKGGYKNAKNITLAHDQEQAEQGRGRIYPRDNLRAYSPQYWQLCQQYIETKQQRLDLTSKDLKYIIKLGVKV